MTRLLIVCAFAIVALAKPAAAADHYLCYGVQAWNGHPLPPAVKLQDQFGAGQTPLLKPRYLCNPVDKNGEGIQDKEAHLVCYDVKPNIKKKDVNFANQFGEGRLVLAAPSLLCVPSKKSIQ
jgi:hypothetical protein